MKILKNLMPILVIMIIAWVGMLFTLYIINTVIILIPTGITYGEKLLFSIIKLTVSAIIAITWLSLWFLMTLKYRNYNIKREV